MTKANVLGIKKIQLFSLLPMKFGLFKTFRYTPIKKLYRAKFEVLVFIKYLNHIYSGRYGDIFVIKDR